MTNLCLVDLPRDMLVHMLEGVADRREWQVMNALLRVLRVLHEHYYCQEDGSDHYLRQLQLRCTDATGHSLMDGRCFLGIVNKPSDPFSCPGWKTITSPLFQIKVSEHRVGDILHCFDGPAHIVHRAVTGWRDCEYWVKNGKVHRLDGPAIRMWSQKGHKLLKFWLKDGSRHRLDGPAQTTYDRETGIKTNEDWFIHGVLQMSKTFTQKRKKEIQK